VVEIGSITRERIAATEAVLRHPPRCGCAVHLAYRGEPHRPPRGVA
jgi:hypothetical protein